MCVHGCDVHMSMCVYVHGGQVLVSWAQNLKVLGSSPAMGLRNLMSTTSFFLFCPPPAPPAVNGYLALAGVQISHSFSLISSGLGGTLGDFGCPHHLL